MKIKKSDVTKLRKKNQTELAKGLGVSKQLFNIWLKNEAISSDYIPELEKLAGFQIIGTCQRLCKDCGKKVVK